MKRYLLLSLFSMICGLTTYAYDVEIDGIYYNLNLNDNTASVTYMSDNGGSYSGSVTIPPKIRNYHPIHD